MVFTTNNQVNLNISGQIAKDIDNIRYTSALSSHAINNLHHASQLNNKFNHMVSRSETLEFSDPSSEEWYSAIEGMNSRRSIGLTDWEVKETTMLSVELTSMVTTVVPISNSSHKCKDRLLLKRMLVPLVNHKSCTEVTLINGRLYPKYGNMSTYILLSQDAVLSKSTKMFGQDIHVIGRTCRIHNSVNATSSQSADALFEDFNFQFEGNMTLTESCPMNGTRSSFN